MTVHLILPEPPSANTYWRHVGRNVVLSAAAKQYRQDVMAIYLQTIGGKIAFPVGALTVKLAWYRSRKAGDLDNRLKQSLDALRQLAYKDDAQIAEIHAVRYEAPKAGKLLVWISPYADS